MISRLLSWYNSHKRPLPWRMNQDPYSVLVSEIMLQQTRVETVISYFSKFLDEFPSAKSLAQAEEAEVLKLWEGLGYYQRVRNLKKACEAIVNQKSGKFPRTSKELAELPGIGEYTSRAVASLGFSEPVPVLDGNVFRVAARYFTLKAPRAEARATRRFYACIEAELFDSNQPSESNQALMELGALICAPKNPDCVSCPIRAGCQAFEIKAQDKYPVARVQPAKKRRNLYLFLGNRNNEALWTEKPWKGYQKGFLHPLWVESVKPLTEKEVRVRFKDQWSLILKSIKLTKPFSHQITRYSLQCHVVFEKYQDLQIPPEKPRSTLLKKAISNMESFFVQDSK